MEKREEANSAVEEVAADVTNMKQEGEIAAVNDVTPSEKEPVVEVPVKRKRGRPPKDKKKLQNPVPVVVKETVQSDVKKSTRKNTPTKEIKIVVDNAENNTEIKGKIEAEHVTPPNTNENESLKKVTPTSTKQKKSTKVMTKTPKRKADQIDEESSGESTESEDELDKIVAQKKSKLPEEITKMYGQVVWCRLQGFPYWPAYVFDPTLLATKMLKSYEHVMDTKYMMYFYQSNNL